MTIDWKALSGYLGEVRRASRASADPVADGSVPGVSPARVLAFRARAQHLDGRLEAGAFARAAWGGLKDSAPRDALFALHARVAEVGRNDWEHDDLVQIWFRWADHVVPRRDAEVFTLGALPRDPVAARGLDALGRSVADLLDGGSMEPGEVFARLDLPERMLLRAANVSGRFFIRWDARTVTLRTAPPPTMEPEDARLELARRFLGWFGPASARRFARWAGISREDADRTWTALGSEITRVAVLGRERSLLGSDQDALHAAEPPSGVRLLPMGDPLLAPDPAIDPGGVPHDLAEAPRRLLNSLTGRILCDGAFVGAWGRRQNHVTIWLRDPVSARDRVLSEAAGISVVVGREIRLREL